MNSAFQFEEKINLHVERRISAEDAARQASTAREIIRRLGGQPGVILADEVGMGKTFVALAVAVSVALHNRGRRPVVIMIPSSLREKWPRDFELFRERCLPPELAKRVTHRSAQRAVEFLKLLDEPKDRAPSLIFVTHGALSRGLHDKWVMLAMIRQALLYRRGTDELRKAVARFSGDLLRMKYLQKGERRGVWADLLRTPPDRWLGVLHAWGIDSEGDDDPVPASVCDVLPALDTGTIFEALQLVPLRRSKNYDKYIRDARREIVNEMRTLWKQCLQHIRLRMPLLILDEAHHLKNPQTELATLFRSEDAAADAEELVRGPLAGGFERMLFLTATPFQLGHAELCSVLDRFEGIRWSGARAPECGRTGFQESIQDLRNALDRAQRSAVRLDRDWSRLTSEDLRVGETTFEDPAVWWAKAKTGSDLTPTGHAVLQSFATAMGNMRAAEKHLRPWVIRHLKPRHLPDEHRQVPRRRPLPGRSIVNSDPDERGIEVGGEALLAFLLAARATALSPRSRPVFAEGLASSYEAFLHTRSSRRASGPILDGDDEEQEISPTDGATWYLDRLAQLIPQGDVQASLAHPKIGATVRKATELWERGEKVVVFCHYVATGRTLRLLLSRSIESRIRELAAAKLGMNPLEVDAQLERIGNRFFDKDSPLRQACDKETLSLLESYPKLKDDRDALVKVVRSYVRTPSFLVRYFPIDRPKLGPDEMAAALETQDASQLTLRELLRGFFEFLADRCGTEDRRRYVGALSSVQTGSHHGLSLEDLYSSDEIQGERTERLLPNVRLVNGSTKSDTRQRLMLTFNTPFHPEVLVASNVLAEGVDLHLNCRYVIHHDLCWNPSTLEQRTGRVDRISAKAERCGHPIHVYLPFVGETQDEKMYRVVTDRERWFSVVMGEKYEITAFNTDKLAERVPFPESAARELAFRLEAAGPVSYSD